MLDKIELKTKLKAMYILTIAGAGAFGVLMLIVPEFVMTLFQQPPQDPYFYGIVASTYFAFGIVSVFGLYNPEKYIPILVFQLIQKVLWVVIVLIPHMIVDGAQFYTIALLVIYLIYIIGNLLTLPFKELLKRN